MRYRFLSLLPFICLLVWGVRSGSEFAQQPASPPSPGIYFRAIGDWEVMTVKGLPFSAEGFRTVEYINPSGRTIITRLPLRRYRIYRDKEGRVRQDLMYDGQGKSREPDDMPLLVLVTDPVAGIVYQLRPPVHTMRGSNLTGREYTSTPAPPPQVTYIPADRPPDVPWGADELGTQLIEGFKSAGWRWPKSVVNDQPVEEAHEDWYSPDLQVSLMMARKDSKSLLIVDRLSNIVREEPPAELFQVPSDYTLEDTNQASVK